MKIAPTLLTLSLLFVSSLASAAKPFQIDGTYKTTEPCQCLNTDQASCESDPPLAIHAFMDAFISSKSRFGYSKSKEVVNGVKETAYVFRHDNFQDEFKVRQSDELTYKITETKIGYKIDIENKTKPQGVYSIQLYVPTPVDATNWILNEEELYHGFEETVCIPKGSAGVHRPGCVYKKQQKEFLLKKSAPQKLVVGFRNAINDSESERYFQCQLKRVK